MLVAVFGDAHAHADALDAVIRSAEAAGAQEPGRWATWSAAGRIRSTRSG